MTKDEFIFVLNYMITVEIEHLITFSQLLFMSSSRANIVCPSLHPTADTLVPNSVPLGQKNNPVESQSKQFNHCVPPDSREIKSTRLRLYILALGLWFVEGN